MKLAVILSLALSMVGANNFNPQFPYARSQPQPRGLPQRTYYSMPVARGGPNKCQGGRQCCPGWKLNPQTGTCTVPTCRSPCGIGICRRPNLCQCLAGGFGATCNGGGQNNNGCQRRCMNGGRCQSEICICKPGYIGQNCEQAVCRQPCLNGGRCVAPNRCACQYGYAGLKCEEDHRVMPCFTRIEDNMCKGQLVGVKCTRASCCATVGAAWGVPCSRCPEKRECPRGYFKDRKTATCKDINECRGIPNICAMGTCVNTEGSYRCECGNGRRYNANKFECSDVDECKLNSGLCEFGKCVNTDGSFKCECRAGFKAILDGKRCVAKDTFDKCYASYGSGKCTSSSRAGISKHTCCCSNPNKAFGFCNLCPAKEQKAYRALGCADDGGTIGKGGDGKGGVGDGGKPPEEVDFCKLNHGLCEFGRCEKDGDSFRCICNSGYRPVNNGKRCKAVDKFDICYRKFDHGACRNSILGHQSKRDCCCGNELYAFGYCRQCPAKGTEGYRGLVCDDDKGNIGEGGDGKGGVGDGGKLPGEKDVCKSNPGLCEFGRCVSEGVTFRCECNSGYKPVNNGKRCQAEKTYDVCYLNYQPTGQCSSPASGQLSKRVCCCGKRNQAFGLCNQCPAKGSAEYRALVCADDRGNIGEGGKGKGGDGDEGSDNVCVLNPGLCEFGSCEKTGNSFRCNCNKGYRSINNGRRCIALEKYAKCYNNHQCSKATPLDVSKTQCCCGSPQNAFGKCNRCPKKGEEAYRELGCSDDRGNIDEGKGGDGDNGGDNDINGGDNNNNGGDSNNNNGDKNLVGDGKDGDKECQSDIFDPKCKNGKCHTINNKATCMCDKGYSKNRNNYCADVDECRKYDGYCHGGQCQNTPGGFKCLCPEGYKQSADGFSCTDIDECDDKSTCRNGVCKNFPGTFQCRCNKGFESSGKGDSCVDRDECLLAGACPGDGRCVNTVGSYQCDCPVGYTANANNVCVDVNECQTIPGICAHGHCVNVGGSFKCVCPAGYELAPDGQSCKDRDECAYIQDVCYGGKCINGDGSYRCQCNYGFKVSPSGTYCMETRKDECFAKYNGLQCSMPLMSQLTRMKCCCGMENTGMRAWGQKCESCPKKGTRAYKRVCMHGPGMDETGTDIDECKNNAGVLVGICDHGRCVNMMKDYKCECNSGFKQSLESNKLCEDVNECTVSGICAGGRCTNTIGGYTCVCPVGYRFNRQTKVCEDEDECQNNPCIGGTCFNTQGSFRCECPQGSSYDSKRRLCKDQREGHCYEYATDGNRCEKKIASFLSKSECCNGLGKAWGSPCEKCQTDSRYGCKQGFKRMGSKCIDIDECKFSTACLNGRCVNQEGSFRCICPTGYQLEGFQCKDMRTGVCYRKVENNKCGMPLVDNSFKKSNCCCSAFAQAWGAGPTCEVCPLKNSDAYKELCPKGEGFTKKGEDVNECEVSGICVNGRCVNTEGGYKCECNSGYDMDPTGTMCIDIDECSITKGICGPGQCMNTIGSFRCHCDHGFRNDMMMEMCVDIDECSESRPYPCRGGRCINTPGSFKCDCPTGLRTMGAASACEDINECEQAGICPNGVCQNFIGGYHCRCSVGYSPSRDMRSCYDIDECNKNNGGCQYSCTNTDGSFDCGCQPGYELTINRRTCQDVNECERGTPCGAENKCTNQAGGHICTCSVGFRASADARACVDIDECLEDPNACRNGRCINTPGSFICNCEQGYKLEANAMVCLDVDECKLTENGGCHPDAQCMNTVGSYGCQCKAGYDGDGLTCTDMDECVLDLASCAQDAECVNTVGSFACQCKEGFKGDGEICIDINECAEDNSLCEHGTCMNTIGDYKCDCTSGYETSKNGKYCQDKNECLEEASRCDHGYCVNTVGAYTCQCKLGFQLDKSDMKCVDVNECETTGMCTNGVCKNMMGMYKCICEEGKGFMPNKNETACIDMRYGYCYVQESCSGVQLAPEHMRKQYCCCTAPDGSSWQDDSDEHCEKCPSMGTPEYKTLCPGGTSTHVNETTGKIGKHNGCDYLPYYCLGGVCRDERGLSCTCPQNTHFNPNTLRCEDVNECETAGICGFNAQCNNKPNGYTCKCGKGSTFDPTTNFCIDTRNSTCFMSNVNTKGECTRPLPLEVTIGQCCCGTPGNRYGPACTACPAPNTGEREALCVGKPTVKPVITGQPPIGPTKPTPPPTTTDSSNDGDNNNGGTTAKPTTIDPKNDINECIFYPDICGQGRCVNLIGSFRCDCDQGFQTKEINNMNKCMDIDECESSPCENGICNNIEGAFYCTCKEGMMLDETNTRCVDLNECDTEGYCDNGHCGNLEDGQGFTCQCHKGFTKSLDEKTCEDMDECKMPGICVHGQCKNTAGGYRCECDQGFKKNAAGECADLNECADFPDLCRHGHCINLIGSFMCECEKGFQQDATKQSCPDVNECKLPGYCEHGRCRNTVGSAICMCNTGFEKTVDGTSCEDLNECEDPDNPCQIGGTCVNMVGTFRCLCNTGFVSDSSGRQCIDIRRSFCFSALENNQCTYANGLNITKSTCCCSMGAGWGDPCELCPEKGTKAFDYYCPNGVGLERNNTDINECEANLGICTNGKCVNTDGSFRCACDAGYKLSDHDPTVCEDRNECTDGTLPCGGGNCTNLIGSFLCDCEAGYTNTVENPVCRDIDECQQKPKPCAFRCENLEGSYQCLCPRGFKLSDNNKHCVDINECEDTHICPFRCKNVVGSYRCLCPDGYHRDIRGNCIEINECLRDINLCRPGGFCQNIEGSYRCACTPPFMRSADGLHCQDKSMELCFSDVVDGICQGSSSSQMEKVSQIDCCCTGGGVAWGKKCSHCPNLNSPAGRSLCTGHQNRTIDECKFIAGVCANGKCMDTSVSFRCMCNQGYKLSMSGKHCNDINECTSGIHKCVGKCKNTEGGYTCVCPKGFTLGQDQITCIDENECASGKHDCQHQCINTEGGYKCHCPHGYETKRDTCEDIDECKEQGICGIANCRNVAGGYECNCNRGLKFDKDKKACVYITDDTVGTVTDTGGGCQYRGGGCGGGCGQGFYSYNAGGYSQCIDINECRQNMCGQSTCQNTLGSYKCLCPPGAEFQNGRCLANNGCNGQSPCSYGCSSNSGGFACQCPPNYYPMPGGHCVATEGVVCFSCDTSDIPTEGIPLGGGGGGIAPTSAPFNNYQTAVGEGSVPLGGGTGPLRYPQQQPPAYARPNPYQANPYQQQQFVNPYKAFRHQPQPQQHPQKQQYQQQQYYNPYARHYRSSRASQHAQHVTVSAKTPRHTAIMSIVSLLKSKAVYELTKGDTELFQLVRSPFNHAMYLNTTQSLTPGHYRVYITSKQEQQPDSVIRVRVKVL